MTDKQKKIIELYKGGRSKLGIAKDVGVSRAYVYEFLIQQGLYRTPNFKHIKRKH